MHTHTFLCSSSDSIYVYHILPLDAKFSKPFFKSDGSTGKLGLTGPSTDMIRVASWIICVLHRSNNEIYSEQETQHSTLENLKLFLCFQTWFAHPSWRHHVIQPKLVIMTCPIPIWPTIGFAYILFILFKLQVPLLLQESQPAFPMNHDEKLFQFMHTHTDTHTHTHTHTHVWTILLLVQWWSDKDGFHL